MPRRLLLAAALLIGSLAVALGPTAVAAAPLRFVVQQLPGASGGTEPQLAVAPDGTRYAMTAADVTTSSGSVGVYRSSAAGGPFVPTASALKGTRVIGPDVDLVVTSSGRLVATEEDSAALSLVVNYSDDRGKTWTQSTGLSELADEDRPWLAAGPHHTVFLLFHNGFSSNATQNMFVERSTDDGATFGAPLPITLPGTAAFSDLQCADSGGPSALLVNAKTGQLYAIWGTRHGPLGGCGVLPLEPFTLVPADRIWVATSATGKAGSWKTALAVDDSAKDLVVGMQLSPASLDTAGNLWLAWTTPPHAYPDDSGAGISLRHASPDLSHWSTPVSVVPAQEPGHVLAQLVAGSPGKVGLLYLTGSTAKGRTVWRAQASVVTGALGRPTVTTATLSPTPAYGGTATDLMGSGCDPSTSPVGTVKNNPVTCVRSADVIGIALDRSCRLTVTWPSVSAKSNDFVGSTGPDATWVGTQSGGPSLCAEAVVPPRRTVPPPVRTTVPPHHRAGGSLAATGAPLGQIGGLALVLVLAGAFVRRR